MQFHKRIKQGERIPRFFIPVRRDFARGETECWLFPWAPFVLVACLSVSVFKCVLFDLLDWSEQLDRKIDLND